MKSDPRRYLVEHLNLHASVWAARATRRSGESFGERPPAAGSDGKPGRSPSFVKWAGWAVAACLIIGVAVIALFPWRGASRGPRDFAVLTEAKGCKWESGTLPTEAGAKLGAGRLRLAEGVARIVFDNGTELRLEGPADLELEMAMRVRLHAGRLVARCPESARGFVVTTPSALLTDFGTEFGVSVDRGRPPMCKIRGAWTSHAGRTEELLTGRGCGSRPTPRPPRPEGRRPEDGRRGSDTAPGQRMVTITTAADGERHLRRGRRIPPIDPTLILVKSTVLAADTTARDTSVDLADLAKAARRDAQLSHPDAHRGLASEVPTARSTVYGLT